MKCELCGKKLFEVLRSRLRHGVKRKVLKCRNCALVFLEPAHFDAKDFYGKDYRSTYTPIVGEKTDSKQIFNLYREYQKERVERLSPILRKNMRVLDIGSSAGHFLYTLRPYVKECVALEFNKADVAFMKQKLKLRAYSVSLPETDLPKEYFDLITVFQAFEHIEKPLEFLSQVMEYLKPEGRLAIEVPNIDEALLTLYDIRPYADFCFKEAHLFYYSPKTLKTMTEKAGFKGSISSIQRMNFLNHINWVMTQSPQKGPHIHMAPAKLATAKDAKPVITKALNAWLQKTDASYRDFLNRSGIGESIWFVGKKVKKIMHT